MRKVFDARIAAPLQAHACAMQHLPLLLTARGVCAVNTERLEELRDRTSQHLRFIVDSRFADGDLSGCMLVGFRAKPAQVLSSSWLYADLAHEIFGFEVDVDFKNWRPSLLNSVGENTITLHH